MPHRLTLALAAGGLLAAPVPASAATAALDRPCYVSAQPGMLALSGFAPNVSVTVSNTDLGSRQLTTDATGSVSLNFIPPSGSRLARPGSEPFVVTATEDANAASTATATSRVAPLAFSTNGGTKSPKAARSWYFSGWTPGKAIYAHFRLAGRTKGTHRFGVAKGPCGEDKRRAPGIAVAGSVAAGKWTVQVDQVKRYRASPKPSLRDTTVVYRTFHSRGAALSAAPAWARDAFLPQLWR